MNKFLVLYLAPVSVLDEWMNKDPEERKAEEDRMKDEWDAWMEKHGSMVKETNGAGKTKRATPDGVADARNDVMMYSIVEADDHAAAAAIFEDHPHLQIPQATIDIMAVNDLSGM
ncbi:MAG: hypothetical protein V4681_03200 [Patescibacteria group bacterium]